MSDDPLIGAAGEGETSPVAEDTFRSPDLVPNVPGLMTYTELEQRLEEKHASVRMAFSMIAFRIDNAEAIYAAAGPSEYAAMLTHVASVILALIDDPELMFAHAGPGEFLSLVKGPLPCQVHVLRQDIALHLAASTSAFMRIGLPAPVVRVGEPMAIAFSCLARPRDQLERVRSALREGTTRPRIRLVSGPD